MKKVVLGALLGMAAIPAMANHGFFGGALLGMAAIPAMANHGFFSQEILLGRAYQEVKSDSSYEKGNDTPFGIRGAYNLNKNIGFELSYIDHGEISYTFIDGFGDIINDRISSTALNIGVKGAMPFGDVFSLQARLGLSFWKVELEETDSAFPGETFRGDDSGRDFYYGIGVQCTINPRFTVGVEYIEYDGYVFKPDGDFQGEADIEVKVFAVTAGFNF